MNSKTEGYWLKLAAFILAGPEAKGYEEWLDSLNDTLPPLEGTDADTGSV